MLLPTAADTGLPVMVKLRSDAGDTAVVMVAVLLPGIGSVVLAPTIEVVVMGLTTKARIWIVTVAVPPFAKVPRLVSTLPEAVAELPCDELTERMLTFCGNRFVTITFWAVTGPRLVTETV